MHSEQQGMALVSVVLMLTVLLALAGILTEKIWQSTRQAAAAAHREQVFWAAQAGLEIARQQLASSYASSSGWQSLLTAGAAPRAYPALPTWSAEVNGLPVDIYLRDNPDGDADALSDNDLKIFVLARARGPRGAEALLESLCGFTSPAGASTGQGGNGGVNLSGLPVRVYNIAD